MSEKQQLGPEQEEWVAYLEANPEQQYKGMLGGIIEDKLMLCCLGAKVLLDYKRENKEPCYVQDDSGKPILWIYTGSGNNKNLYNLSRFEEIGLKDDTGTFWDNEYFIGRDINDGDTPGQCSSLAHLNDFGWTWTEIAALIRENPAKFFNKVA